MAKIKVGKMRPRRVNVGNWGERPWRVMEAVDRMSSEQRGMIRDKLIHRHKHGLVQHGAEGMAEEQQEREQDLAEGVEEEMEGGAKIVGSLVTDYKKNASKCCYEKPGLEG